MDARSITTWVATQISSDERWVESGLVAQHLRPHLPICARTCAQHMRAGPHMPMRPEGPHLREATPAATHLRPHSLRSAHTSYNSVACLHTSENPGQPHQNTPLGCIVWLWAGLSIPPAPTHRTVNVPVTLTHFSTHTGAHRCPLAHHNFTRPTWRVLRLASLERSALSAARSLSSAHNYKTPHTACAASRTALQVLRPTRSPARPTTRPKRRVPRLAPHRCSTRAARFPLALPTTHAPHGVYRASQLTGAPRRALSPALPTTHTPHTWRVPRLAPLQVLRAARSPSPSPALPTPSARSLLRRSIDPLPPPLSVRRCRGPRYPLCPPLSVRRYRGPRSCAHPAIHLHLHLWC